MKGKIWKKITAGVLIAVVLVAVFALYVRPWYQVSSAKKASTGESPTAEYNDLMPDTDEIFSTVKDLVDMGARTPGTPAGDKAKQYVIDKFEELGLSDIEVVPAETDLWQCDSNKLVVGDTEIPSYFMRHTFNDGEYGAFSTPEGGLETEIVYVGEGKESDFKDVDVEGKIVVSDVTFTSVPIALTKVASYCFYDPDNTLSLLSSRTNPYSPDTYPYNYFRAMENGAAGFVGILSSYVDSNEYNNEDYSYLGDNMAIPGLWVTKSDGETIKSMIKDAGGEEDAVLKMTGSVEEVEAGAVIGFLPGESDDIIMVHSHYDSVTPGAVEDASGASVVLAIAEYYSQIPEEERDKTLMFTMMDTHFSDYDSHDAVVEEYFNGDYNILADVCIEHIANEAEDVDGELTLTGEVEPRIVFISKNDALIKITREEMVRQDLDRTILLSATIFGDEVPTDADMFFIQGVPIVSLISGPIYLYDNQDTIDKVAKDELKPTAQAYSDIIWRMMDLDASDYKKESE